MQWTRDSPIVNIEDFQSVNNSAAVASIRYPRYFLSSVNGGKPQNSIIRSHFLRLCVLFEHQFYAAASSFSSVNPHLIYQG